MTEDIKNIIATLRTFNTSQGLKPETVKTRLAELAFLSGYATAKGGNHKLPPAVLLCAMSGRSVLTLDTEGTPS